MATKVAHRHTSQTMPCLSPAWSHRRSDDHCWFKRTHLLAGVVEVLCLSAFHQPVRCDQCRSAASRAGSAEHSSASGALFADDVERSRDVFGLQRHEIEQRQIVIMRVLAEGDGSVGLGRKIKDGEVAVLGECLGFGVGDFAAKEHTVSDFMPAGLTLEPLPLHLSFVAMQHGQQAPLGGWRERAVFLAQQS
jgi:hypothetical protein